MVDLLPPPEERDWILDELARLGRATGWEPLVCAPLLLPVVEFFPDVWSPDARGVSRLARRLQLYAGLEDLGVQVELFEQLQEPALDGLVSNSTHHEGAAAYFAGIVDGVCLYGLDEEHLDDGLAVTATMAHEVAHAFRTRFGLALSSPEQRDEEERLTDLTTIYLGAGVLTTNATARHRSEQAAEGLLGGHKWSFQSLGYLSPASMSFGLAAVAIARGLDRAQRRRIASELEPNQAASFKRAVAWLERECPNLRERLGLPSDSGSWPEPWSLDELTAPFDEPDEDEDDELPDEEDEVDYPWNMGRPVFRVRPGYQVGDNLLIGIVFFGIGSFAATIDLLLAVVVSTVGFFGGRQVIRILGADRCSDSDCNERLPRRATACPNCGGRIMGEIRGRGERLDAEERLDLEGSGRAPPGDPG